MRIVNQLQRCVTKKTINNCFKKARFEQPTTVGEQQLKENEQRPAKETDENSKEWIIIRDELNIDNSFKDFVNVDESLITSEILLTDYEILKTFEGLRKNKL